MVRAVLAIVVLLACSGAFASDQTPVPQAPPAAASSSDDTRLDLQKPDDDGAPKAAESWWQKMVREAPACGSFTDGCRTCSSAYVCSNIGIACQPKDWSCNDANTDPKSEAKPDATPEPKQ